MPVAGKPGRAPSDDDLVLDLPPPDGGDDELDFQPGDDTDLELNGARAGEEVGLDTATGPAEPIEAEITSLDAISLGADLEPAEDLVDGDANLITGSEYGWTSDNEPPEAHEFDTDVVSGETRSVDDDGGQEGFDADNGDDLASLPPLDSGADEDPEETAALAAELLAEASRQARPWAEIGRSATPEDRIFRAWRIRRPAAMAVYLRRVRAAAGMEDEA